MTLTPNDDETLSLNSDAPSDEARFEGIFAGQTEAPRLIEDDEEEDIANAPTRAFSTPALEIPKPFATNPYFELTRSDAEPDTIFDAGARDAARAPREMKIPPEGDGRRLPEGYVINERFEIRRCLGAGQVGTVYLVDDLRLKDKKALKLMHPALVDSEEAARRFISEIKTLQNLSHEHVVRVYDYGKTESGGLSFFTMEYVDGIPLAQLLKKKGGRLPLDRSVGLMVQLLDTLAYAHQQGTHRHLTPINVMVRPTGALVLLNFGISTTNSSSGLPAVPQPFGLDYYQAPEQRANPGVADKRVDIYSAGAIFYQMTTGEVPLHDALPPSRVLRGLPRALDSVVMRCLAEKPEDRYETAEAFKIALERVIRPKTPTWVWGGIALLALALVGAVAWFFLAQ